MVERGHAKEICKNFIPGNEFAAELIRICEIHYPKVIIPLEKFTDLIERCHLLISFCPSEINRKLNINVNAQQMLNKFEETFKEEIASFNNTTKSKRKVEAPAKVVKKVASALQKGKTKSSWSIGQ